MTANASTVATRVGDDPRAPRLPLSEAFWIFTRRLSPRILMSALLGFGIARGVVGSFTVWDAVLFAAALTVHPMTEWLIHTGFLHFRPRRLGRLKIDLHLADEHRKHHADPHNERHWFIPVRSGVTAFVVIGIVAWFVMPTLALWLTVMTTALAIGTVYEWTHYLTHTTYRPRGRLYRRLWRHHRLHHFKNEHYWMGVTMHLGDRILRTLPDAKDVETSPTCRNLIGQGQQADA